MGHASRLSSSFVYRNTSGPSSSRNLLLRVSIISYVQDPEPTSSSPIQTPRIVPLSIYGLYTSLTSFSITVSQPSSSLAVLLHGNFAEGAPFLHSRAVCEKLQPNFVQLAHFAFSCGLSNACVRSASPRCGHISCSSAIAGKAAIVQSEEPEITLFHGACVANVLRVQGGPPGNTLLRVSVAVARSVSVRRGGPPH